MTKQNSNSNSIWPLISNQVLKDRKILSRKISWEIVKKEFHGEKSRKNHLNIPFQKALMLNDFGQLIAYNTNRNIFMLKIMRSF